MATPFACCWGNYLLTEAWGGCWEETEGQSEIKIVPGLAYLG